MVIPSRDNNPRKVLWGVGGAFSKASPQKNASFSKKCKKKEKRKKKLLQKAKFWCKI